jgi:hypothetical protein
MKSGSVKRHTFFFCFLAYVITFLHLEILCFFRVLLDENLSFGRGEFHFLFLRKITPYHWWKVKQSHYRPGQALRVPEGWSSQISRQSAHEGGKVVSRTHRPPLPHSVRGWINLRATVRPEVLCRWRTPMTPSEIEPATFRLIAQCLNQLRHGVPHLHHL